VLSAQLIWWSVLAGLGLFIIVTLGGAALVTYLLVNLPPDYFTNSHQRTFWPNRHPALRLAGLIAKNLIGGVMLVLGFIMALPAVPGPGIVTMFVGVLLLDFPGKRRLEHWILARPRVLRWVNRLRRRYGRPRLILDRRLRNRPHRRAEARPAAL
jgi:hypothetical protein